MYPDLIDLFSAERYTHITSLLLPSCGGGCQCSKRCGWEVIYPVLGPIPNGAGTMVLRGVFLFLKGVSM